MINQYIIDEVVKTVKKRLSGEGSGHDWFHVERVWKMAKRIGNKEKANMSVVELAALLHDVADWKMHSGDDTVGPRVAREILMSFSVDEVVIAHVCNIILNMSFKGAQVKFKMKTLEGRVVQDADRLDAIGAVGVARAFAYGGHKGRSMYDPDIKPVLHASKESYINSVGTTVNHFYEKLLLLKKLMNTKAAKKIAEERHLFMKEFLKRFFNEWEGKE